MVVHPGKSKIICPSLKKNAKDITVLNFFSTTLGWKKQIPLSIKRSMYCQYGQYSTMHCILKSNRRTCPQTMGNKLGLLLLYNRRLFLRFILILKIGQNQQCPEKLVAYLPRRNSMHNKCLRGSTLLNLPKARTATGQNTASKNSYVPGTTTTPQASFCFAIYIYVLVKF